MCVTTLSFLVTINRSEFNHTIMQIGKDVRLSALKIEKDGNGEMRVIERAKGEWKRAAAIG